MKGAKPQMQATGDMTAPLPPPRWLASEAKNEWKRVMPVLTERRILTEADLGGLENYCVCIGRVRDTERMIQKEADAEMQLKLIRVQDKAMASARQLAAELGLTPVSRSRPAIREDDDRDDTANPLDVG